MANSKLYALLVGIDTYEGGVRGLSGCVNDVNNVQAFLQNNYANQFDLQIQTLVNEQATREAIVEKFQTHLSKAQANDYVWFHYSGHGSQELTAVEFIPYTESDKNQTLVCYDSRTEGKYDLADKELGALLYEISKNNPQIIVTLDACHASTRALEQDLATRFEDYRKQQRSYDSYLNGYYSKQNLLEVPDGNYMAFLACGINEQALEHSKDKCGLFTKSLIDTLTLYQSASLSYNDLASLATFQVKNYTDHQHPQSSAMGGFDGTKFFLSNKIDAKRGYYLYQDQGEWLLNIGAAHGVSTNAVGTKVRVLDPFTSDATTLAEGEIAGVGVDSCRINLVSGELKGRPFYAAQLLSAPTELFYVYVADTVVRQQLTAQFGASDLSAIRLESIDNQFDYEVTYENSAYQIKNKRLGKLTIENKDIANTAANLLKIERAERFKKINNPESSLSPADFSLKLTTDIGSPDEKIIEASNDDETIIHINRNDGCKIRLSVENKSEEDYFFMVLYIGRLHSIQVIKNELFMKQKGEKIILASATISLKNTEVESASEQFVLIISKNHLNENDMKQAGLIVDGTLQSGSRDLIIDEDLESKWLVKRIKYQLVVQS